MRNGTAVARTAPAIAGGGAVGVIPGGERWPDGTLRPAIEDLPGTGAILDALDLPGSAEAEMARACYRAMRHDIARLIGDSVSRRELADRDFGADIELAVKTNISTCAPILADGAFQGHLSGRSRRPGPRCVPPSRPEPQIGAVRRMLIEPLRGCDPEADVVSRSQKS